MTGAPKHQVVRGTRTTALLPRFVSHEPIQRAGFWLLNDPNRNPGSDPTNLFKFEKDSSQKIYFVILVSVHLETGE